MLLGISIILSIFVLSKALQLFRHKVPDRDHFNSQTVTDNLLGTWTLSTSMHIYYVLSKLPLIWSLIAVQGSATITVAFEYLDDNNYDGTWVYHKLTL